jgi:molybdate transport system permease protein
LPGTYALWILALLCASAFYTTPTHLIEALRSREIQHSLQLSLATCSVSAVLSVLIAVPAGYLLSRSTFPGKSWVESILDIPIVLPPMTVGLCLLIFFQSRMGRLIEGILPLTYTVSGVILAQLVIGAAFAIRTLRGTFDHLPERPESVAMTLGCSRAQAFWLVTLPAARRGMVAAGSVAWARSLGEFGPVLVFAGATRMKTEVLPTSVWLELSAGNLEAAVAVSVLMVTLAVLVLVAVRNAGERV